MLAMSYGKPIITLRTGTIVETLGAADWLLYEPKIRRTRFLTSNIKKEFGFDTGN